MDAARRQQFEHIEAARSQLLAWASANRIPLVKVEFVVPFVEADHSLHVWLFYDTDRNVERLDDDGTTASIQQQFRLILETSGYPADWLPHIAFSVDSHENVECNHDGSYFYRLR